MAILMCIWFKGEQSVHSHLFDVQRAHPRAADFTEMIYRTVQMGCGWCLRTSRQAAALMLEATVLVSRPATLTTTVGLISISQVSTGIRCFGTMEMGHSPMSLILLGPVIRRAGVCLRRF